MKFKNYIVKINEHLQCLEQSITEINNIILQKRKLKDDLQA